MARARRQRSNSESEQFQCPECGRVFTRAAALGAHRRRAHGVVGAAAHARAKSSRARSAGARNATVRATAASSAASVRRTPSRRAGRGSASQLDRDALLQKVFPDGVPAREAVIRAAKAWLDDAERLARLK